MFLLCQDVTKLDKHGWWEPGMGCSAQIRQLEHPVLAGWLTPSRRLERSLRLCMPAHAYAMHAQMPLRGGQKSATAAYPKHLCNQHAILRSGLN